MIFADTSALIAVLDADDPRNPLAISTWNQFLSKAETIYTNNYIVVEAIVVLQRRLGLFAAREFVYSVLPVLEVEWIAPATHNTALAVFLSSSRRDLSLVDCVSFELMRARGIQTAFTFDPHFAEQGFECIPAGSRDDAMRRPG